MRYARRVGGLVFLLATAGVLAGCGSSGGAAPAPGNPPGDGALAAYVTCLQHNGVPAVVPSGRPPGPPPSGVRPSGGFGGPGGPGGEFLRPPGVDDATWAKAQQACASVRPSGGPGRGGPGDDGALRAYLNCLREHGVTPSGGPGRINPLDPAVVAADKVCGVLKPSGGPVPTPSPSG